MQFLYGEVGIYNMKYANKLTDEELTDLYKSFLGKDDEFVDLIITRDENSIALEGHIRIPDDEEDAINGMIEIDEDYEITDYNIKAFNHSGNMTKLFREYMYKKFGSKYAKDYLLG